MQNSQTPFIFVALLGFYSLLLSPIVAEDSKVAAAFTTRWADKVDKTAPWPEYPRPQLVRDNWKSLNGIWQYAIQPLDVASSTSKEIKGDISFDGDIVVPYPVESYLSGVGKLVEPNQLVWYRRTFKTNDIVKSAVKKSATADSMKRTLLHFEALDYEATVWVNRTEVGTHRGGHTPFTFDISETLLDDGENELIIRVKDETEGYQLNGKQRLNNNGIFYTRATGIWQSVWLEVVPDAFIVDIDYTCDIKTGKVTVKPKISNMADKVSFTVKVMDGESEVGKASGSTECSVQIPNVKLWTPETPNLYNVHVELLINKAVVDKVDSYTAFREFGKTRDAEGNLRLTLNGKNYFHWGPLDQGWWPDGLITPPSDEAMKFDIDFLKSCGFNMIRKHIKVEPRRYYAHCDKVGMLIWQDQVSGGPSPNWTRMADGPVDAKWPDDAHQQWVIEYKRMVDHLRNVPSIAVWVPFNEAWGQHSTLEVGHLAKEYDKTRLINIASGGNYWPVGDIADEHSYPHPAFPFNAKKYEDMVKVVGEFGGHGWAVKDHLWKRDANNWGYGGLPQSLEEWKQRYAISIQTLAALKSRGIAGGVYTQTTDVEGEVNGLLTYDRIEKVERSWLREQSEFLLSSAENYSDPTWLFATAEKADDSNWQYTETRPDKDWVQSKFIDKKWQSGIAGFGAGDPPNTTIHTTWNSSDIWLRKKFNVGKTTKSDRIILRIYHDEDCQVFLNGTQIISLTGYVTNYVEVVLPSNELQIGENTIAISCHQTGGGQFIDAGLMMK